MPLPSAACTQRAHLVLCPHIVVLLADELWGGGWVGGWWGEARAQECCRLTTGAARGGAAAGGGGCRQTSGPTARHTARGTKRCRTAGRAHRSLNQPCSQGDHRISVACFRQPPWSGVHDAARVTLQQGPQLGNARRLHVSAAGKRAGRGACAARHRRGGRGSGRPEGVRSSIPRCAPHCPLPTTIMGRPFDNTLFLLTLPPWL